MLSSLLPHLSWTVQSLASAWCHWSVEWDLQLSTSWAMMLKTNYKLTIAKRFSPRLLRKKYAPPEPHHEVTRLAQKVLAADPKQLNFKALLLQTEEKTFTAASTQSKFQDIFTKESQKSNARNKSSQVQRPDKYGHNRWYGVYWSAAAKPPGLHWLKFSYAYCS